jgi:hypothetical protein
MRTDARYAYVSRVASIQAGLSMDSVAMQVSRLCASGLQGIVTTAQNIMLNDADYGIGGGVEVMSKAAYLMPTLRSGARMGDTKAVDSMVAVLTDPFGVGHMGITAENLAEKHGITREQQDEFAVESQRRAAAAIDAGNTDRFPRVQDLVGSVATRAASTPDRELSFVLGRQFARTSRTSLTADLQWQRDALTGDETRGGGLTLSLTPRNHLGINISAGASKTDGAGTVGWGGIRFTLSRTK